MAKEKVLTTVPMGGSARRDLVQDRRVLADRLYLLEVERETNPTVAAFVEAKRSKGDERDLAAAVDKYAKMKKSEKQASSTGAGGESARGGSRDPRRVQRGPKTSLSRVSANADGPLYFRVSEAGPKARRLL
jgi:hypothetical protein